MQQRTLIRAANLAAFRAALVDRALAGDPLDARRRVVLVPTRAAADLLRQTIEETAVASGRRALVLPDLLTRDEWLAALHAALPDAPPLLSRMEREVILARASESASRRKWLGGAPFELRPGLVAAMLDFYDELRRRGRAVRRFSHAVFAELRVERGSDRGSEGLLRQTMYLGFAFLAYERAITASGAWDEHRLRESLHGGPGPHGGPGLQTRPPPYDHVIVAVADHPADPRGLWPADFDLLGRMRGVTRLDVVVTDETHDAGFRERVERELPGIDTVRAPAIGGPPPVLVRPRQAPSEASGATDPEICQVSRDREEEIRDVARIILARAAPAIGADPETAAGTPAPVAIVFHRPLPYLYLGRHVLAEAGVAFQAFDALPLAAEPYAALLDLVLAMARTGGTREAAVALLRSRLIRVALDGTPAGLRDVAALDAVLAARRAVGESDTYLQDVAAFFGAKSVVAGLERSRAERAARAAALLRDVLLPFRTAGAASAQLASLAACLRRFEVRSTAGDQQDDPRPRHERARAAVLGVLDALSEAFARHDDRPRDPAVLVAHVHHAVEARTFAPGRGRSGVRVVEAMAARFGAFDHVHLVGLVETDWPERARRSIFYTSGLLRTLGWPQESDQVRAGHAAFRDLLGLAARTVRLHAFQLDGDAIVARSPLVEAARDLPSVADDLVSPLAALPDEGLAAGARPAALSPDRAAWLDLRWRRRPLDDPQFGGSVAPRAAAAYRVSRVDRYVDCPFKYFAENVLELHEERGDMAGLTPLERGSLVHELFERFYRDWTADGRGTITAQVLPEALERFTRLTQDALADLPAADRTLETTRLLGSIVARGLAERVFELEADAGGEIVDRRLERALQGPFVFPVRNGFEQTTIQVRGKADRIDVFADGSLRVVDYKLGRLPDTDVSVQIGVYAHCAQLAIEAEDGRSHPVRSAMYIAFGDDRRLDGSLGDNAADTAFAVAARASDFAGAVHHIESGRFPPRPRRPGDCQFCGYAGVCRKEYRLGDEEAGEP